MNCLNDFKYRFPEQAGGYSTKKLERDIRLSAVNDAEGILSPIHAWSSFVYLLCTCLSLLYLFVCYLPVYLIFICLCLVCIFISCFSASCHVA